MMKIEAVIQPCRLDDVKAALDALGVEVMMISGIRDHGVSAGGTAYYRGAEYRVDMPKVKLELLASADRTGEVIDALMSSARTFEPADNGVILVYEVADALRIRTGARLQYSLA